MELLHAFFQKIPMVVFVVWKPPERRIAALISGLNLAFFSITKLRLQVESKKNNLNAIKVEENIFLLY